MGRAWNGFFKPNFNGFFDGLFFFWGGRGGLLNGPGGGGLCGLFKGLLWGLRGRCLGFCPGRGGFGGERLSISIPISSSRALCSFGSFDTSTSSSALRDSTFLSSLFSADSVLSALAIAARSRVAKASDQQGLILLAKIMAQTWKKRNVALVKLLESYLRQFAS